MSKKKKIIVINKETYRDGTVKYELNNGQTRWYRGNTRIIGPGENISNILDELVLEFL